MPEFTEEELQQMRKLEIDSKKIFLSSVGISFGDSVSDANIEFIYENMGKLFNHTNSHLNEISSNFHEAHGGCRGHESFTVSLSPDAPELEDDDQRFDDGMFNDSDEEVELGDIVEDDITGFKGCVVSITHALEGSSRVEVQPVCGTDTSVLASSKWFELDRVEVIS